MDLFSYWSEFFLAKHMGTFQPNWFAAVHHFHAGERSLQEAIYSTFHFFFFYLERRKCPVDKMLV